MADHTSSDSRFSGGAEGGGREAGRRPGGPRDREPGGFRIRLSDNEMRAARAIQEAFRLRSTVAALGFSIRTVADLLEQGQLDALVAEQRSQSGPRGGAGGGERHGDRPSRRGDERPGGPRINPLARPSKPVVVASAATEAVTPEPHGEEPASPEDQPQAEAGLEAAAEPVSELGREPEA